MNYNLKPSNAEQKMPAVHIYKTSELLVTALAKQFYKMVCESLGNQDSLNIALSGGTTPIQFFKILADYQTKIPWSKIHIFWVDERCVNPDDIESNFGMTKEKLLDKIDIPAQNIHRIYGEAEPESEAKRYSQEILKHVKTKDHWPIFDWILLGMGKDGHTASLFPGSSLLDVTQLLTAVAIHPETGQQRITLTLPVLNNAKKVVFLVSGSSKKDIIKEVIRDRDSQVEYPVTMVKPVPGSAEWYLDRPAAAEIS